MRNVTIKAETERDRILLGRRGENEATEIVFDVSQLIATYGNGTAQLAAKLPNSSTPYPVSVTQDGNTVTWVVTNADTQTVGNGACELFWYVGETLAKSIVYTTVVLRDIGDVGDTPPDPYETWVEQVLTAGMNAQEAAQEAIAAAESVEDALSRITVTQYTDSGDGNIIITEVIPNG